VILNSGLDGLFDYVLSTDLVRAYKLDPRAYQMAIDAFQLQRNENAFSAFAGWDAAGAKAFGYSNMLGQPPEPARTETRCDSRCHEGNLNDLAAWLGKLRRRLVLMRPEFGEWLVQ